MPEALHPFQSVSAILAVVQQVHQDCCDQFAEVAMICSDPRRKALLSFLAEREAEQLVALRRLLSTDDDALKSFVQSVPADALAVASEAHDPNAAIEDVVERYGLRDLALIHFYAQLADNVGPRASTLLRGLLAMRQHTQAQLRTALLDF